MASHMLRRFTKNAFAASFLRRQAIRLASTTPRLTFAVNKYSQQPIIINHGVFPTQLSAISARCFASGSGEMTMEELQERVVNVVKLFDKVKPELITIESHFINDLGLDSLDVVEIVMAFEDEFAVEISDEEAEKIMTLTDAVEFLKKSLDVH